MANVVDESVLECSICSSRLRDPCGLPCYHVYCRSCITTWLTKTNSGYCPTCRRPATASQVQRIPCVSDIIENATAAFPCPSCKSNEEGLAICDHCSQSICRKCREQHMNQIKEEISKLCQTLTDVTGPRLEQQQTEIMQLMSESSSAKERLTRELREAHENLVSQIHSLRQKSLDTLDNVAKASSPEQDQQMENVNDLVARIEAISSSSAKIIAERDIGKLMQLDEEISKLQADIDDIQGKLANDETSNPDGHSGKVTLSNIKINPAYKNIAALISETDMLKKIT